MKLIVVVRFYVTIAPMFPLFSRHVLRLLPLLLICVPLMATTAYSQIPFYTDDADTTEKGKFHIEMYDEHDVLQKSAYPTKRQNTLVFTLNYGLTKKMELGINAPLITLSNSRVAIPRNVTGQGDVQFGAKYRLRDEREGSKLPAFSAVFYVEAPTGSTDKELGSGLTDFWLYGIAQKSVTKTTKLRLNGGILFSGNSSTGLIGIRTERGHIYTGNASLVRDFTDRLSLGVELFGAVTGNLKFESRPTDLAGRRALRVERQVEFDVCHSRRAFCGQSPRGPASRLFVRFLSNYPELIHFWRV